MKLINKINLEGIGIAFEKESDLQEFCRVVTRDLKIRIDNAISDGLSLSEDELYAFEKMLDSSHADDDKEFALWLNKHCHPYVEKELNKIWRELEKYKGQIVGLT